MGRLARFSLLKFLSRPRLVHEIAEHYGVSKWTAVFHLREAMKSGQVLASKAPVFRTIKDSSGSLKKLRGFAYVYHKSPILAPKDSRYAPNSNHNSISDLGTTSRTISLPEPNDASWKAKSKHGQTSSSFVNKTSPENLVANLEANDSLISKLNVSLARVAPANHARLSCLPPSRLYSNSKSKPLLYVEKIRLFQALLREPLSFLDLHCQFNVSRQTITRLVKKGLLMETWGSKGVGVTFKLTSKGKTYLKELEAAARYKPRLAESPLTRLKQRSVV